MVNVKRHHVPQPFQHALHPPSLQQGSARTTLSSTQTSQTPHAAPGSATAVSRDAQRHSAPGCLAPPDTPSQPPSQPLPPSQATGSRQGGFITAGQPKPDDDYLDEGASTRASSGGGAERQGAGPTQSGPQLGAPLISTGTHYAHTLNHHFCWRFIGNPGYRYIDHFDEGRNSATAAAGTSGGAVSQGAEPTQSCWPPPVGRPADVYWCSHSK